MKRLLKFSTLSYKCLNLSVCDKLWNVCAASRYFASRCIIHREPYLSGICYRLPVQRKQICTTAVVNAKRFADGENVYAHTVFERLPIYSQTLAPATIELKHVSEEKFQEIVTTDWRDRKVDDVYAAFERVSHYVASHPHDISDELFNNLCAAVADKSEQMTDENLIGILRCLRLWPMAKSVETPNFAKIWRSVDKECVIRIKSWDLDKVLYVCDHWYKLYLVRKSEFMWFGNFKLGKNEFAYGRELLCLDVGVELECPDYKGQRLSQKKRSRITKSNTKWIPSREKRNHSHTDKFMLEMMDSLEEILGGAHNLHVVHILPQYERADIVFGMDNNGKPSNIPTQFKELPLHHVKPPPANDSQTSWYAVVIGGWNLFVRGENRPVGATVTKIRQLKRLGYEPILVSWFDWSEMQPEEKREFLKNVTTGKQRVRSIGQS